METRRKRVKRRTRPSLIAEASTMPVDATPSALASPDAHPVRLGRSIVRPSLIVSVLFVASLILSHAVGYGDLSRDEWLSLLTVAALAPALATGIGPPDLLLLAATSFLALTGTISADEAFAGFASPSLLAVAALFPVAEGLARVGVVDVCLLPLFGTTRSVRPLIARLAPIGILSAFLNNTPLVALLIPTVEKVARSRGVPVSQLLMPLSFTAILGGTCSLLGSSTNLLVVSLAKQRLPSFSAPLFEIALVGVPAFIVGLLYMVALAPLLLRGPRRRAPGDQPSASPALSYTLCPRSYQVDATVDESSPLIGLSLDAAGLRHLGGLFVVQLLRRSGELLSAPPPTTTLMAGDVILFSGDPQYITDDLWLRLPGVIPAPAGQVVKAAAGVGVTL